MKRLFLRLFFYEIKYFRIGLDFGFSTKPMVDIEAWIYHALNGGVLIEVPEKSRYIPRWYRIVAAIWVLCGIVTVILLWMVK